MSTGSAKFFNDSQIFLVVDYLVSILIEFFLGSSIQTFFDEISAFRAELESQTVDSGNTGETVQLITRVQQLKNQVKVGQEQVEHIKILA